eukprot:9448660-Ditylum_brightwellii.AAC.1
MAVFPKCSQNSKMSTSETLNYTPDAQMEYPGMIKASKSINKKYYLQKLKNCTCSKIDYWQEIKA